jgi:hypothetical protein
MLSGAESTVLKLKAREALVRKRKMIIFNAPGTPKENEELILFITSLRPTGESYGGIIIILVYRPSPEQPRRQTPRPA